MTSSQGPEGSGSPNLSNYCCVAALREEQGIAAPTALEVTDDMVEAALGAWAYVYSSDIPETCIPALRAAIVAALLLQARSAAPHD